MTEFGKQYREDVKLGLRQTAVPQPAIFIYPSKRRRFIESVMKIFQRNRRSWGPPS